MKLIRQTVLGFKKGNSDKVYETDLLETSQGYLVHFRYGKRGAKLREGVKTAKPIAFEKAEKIYNSLLVSKINKGYKVLQGFDPIKGQEIGVLNQGGDSSQTRDEKIIARLNAFADDPEKDRIQGYSLSRTLWKAGELSIKTGLVEVIEKLLTVDFKQYATKSLIYYSMLWALGRSKDANALPLLKQFKGKLPENTEYMLVEVELALTEDNSNIPSYNADFDCEKAVNKISLLDQEYESYDLEQLDAEDKVYIDQFMECHQIKEEVKKALTQLNFYDLNQNYLKQYLSSKTYTFLSKGIPACPKLKDAIHTVLFHRHDEYVKQHLAESKPYYDLYMRLIKKIDFDQIWEPNSHYRHYAEQGRLNWFWYEDRKALKAALQATGEVENVGYLWQQVLSYNSLINSYRKKITQKILEKAYQQLQLDGVYEQVIEALKKYKSDDGVYWWLNGRYFSPEIRTKYETDGAVLIKRVFKDQFYQLRKIEYKAKDQLLKQYHDKVLGLYWQASHNQSQYEAALDLIKITPVNASFTQVFRRLYKIAEFRNDAEVLAILNYRIEETPPKAIQYGKTKAFSAKTKDYFRRRFLRTLKEVAKFNPQAYPHFAKWVLIQVDDQSPLKKKTGVSFPQLLAFNFILFHNSTRFDLDYRFILRLKRNRKEVPRPEAYPELWDQALDDLLDILIECRSQLANDFAYRRLEKATDFLAEISLKNWIKLVQKPYENTALLALQYLQEHLLDLAVMKAILASPFDHIRAQALAKLDGKQLGEQLDLLVLMLLSSYTEVQQFAKDYLYTAEARYPELSQRLLTVLIATSEPQEQARLIQQIKWLLSHPLQNKTPLNCLVELLKQPDFALQQLASDLLEHSDFKFNEIEACYQLMSASEYPEIRAGALALLAKLENKDKIKHQDLLFSALLGSHASLRQKAVKVLSSIDDSAFQKVIFEQVLPYLFKAEPTTGFNEDILNLILALKPIYPQIDLDLLWRLLNAKSKLAQWAGALIITAHQPTIFSIKQQVLLAKNPTESVRKWALNAFIEDPALIDNHFDQSIRLLDNPWAESRQAALDLFAQFEADFWHSDRIISVCDQIYDDVQQFGRSLMTRFFNAEEGEQYLLKLSQHPSQNIQYFVSGFLVEYASAKPATILALEPYFQTVLSQVNRGRIMKNQIIDFLFKEAQQDATVAEMVARLFSEQSISRVIADKMRYINTLFKLQQKFKHTKTPLKVIQPEVRAI